MKNHSDYYSDAGFWDKLKRFSLAAGAEIIEKALWLYYATQRPETPAWAKAIIAGALGYFIFPLDAIPDVIPVIGYSDDLAAIAAAVATVSLYITEDVKQTARQKMQGWFGTALK